METYRSIQDDSLSNLGSSVGGLHSDQRERYKFPETNKASVSYQKVNKNGNPLHLIYESKFLGRVDYYILECACTFGGHPFGHRGNDFVKAAKRHLSTKHHKDAVLEYRYRLRGILLPSDFFVIEELGRCVRDCSPALANKNNLQFCQRFMQSDETNVKKYCSYDYTSDQSLATPCSQVAALQQAPSVRPDIVMHGALNGEGSAVTSRQTRRANTGSASRPPFESRTGDCVSSDMDHIQPTGCPLVSLSGRTKSSQQPLKGTTGTARRRIMPMLCAVVLNSSTSRHHSSGRARILEKQVTDWLDSLDHSLE